jgi:ribosome-binding protein aMBF1 (putative translation factor)
LIATIINIFQKLNIKKMDTTDEILARITPLKMTQTIRRMGLAAFVADAIAVKGLSHSEFANRIGKKTTDIPLMLSGTYNYTIEELTQIEYVLETKLFFSSELDWWNPEPKKSIYAAHSINLSMAAEP